MSDARPGAAVEDGAGRSLGELLGRLREVVGAANVLAGADDLARFSRDTSPWCRTASVVVSPANTDEVSRVVRLGAEFGLPVWPFSGGKNWGYGASMAYHDGALILLLGRMNRILEVNEELAYAVIEPGVTQGQLDAHLKAGGHRLWADCTDSTPRGSVVGNALERGVGYTPYWDHFANLCGLEVVLPDGEVVRTGGGPPNSRTWHTHKWGSGPYLEGLFSQSNLGIVTRAGVWLMPKPDGFACFLCEVDDEADGPAAVDVIRRLALRGVLQANVHLVNDVMLMAQMMQYPRDLLKPGESRLSDVARRGLRDRFGLAPWTVTGALYGPRGMVNAARREVRAELGRFGRIRFLNDRTFGLLKALLRVWGRHPDSRLIAPVCRLLAGGSLEKVRVLEHLYPIFQGTPGEAILGFAYFKSRGGRPTTDVDPGRDGAGLLWLASSCPTTGRDAGAFIALCRAAFEAHGLDPSITFILVNPRTALGLVEIFYDRSSDDETARALALHDALIATTEREGFPQYRASVADSARMFERASGFLRLLDRIKSAVDPGRVLAPGRYGIGLRAEGRGDS